MINLNPFAKKEEEKIPQVITPQEVRKCKECNKDIPNMRKNKIFCSTNCRGRYNAKGYRQKHNAENPNWGAMKQREYRTKHPEMFAKIMARYHLRKMTYEARHQLLEEVDAVMKS